MKIEFRISGSGPDFQALADDAAGEKISGYKPALRATPHVEPLVVTTSQAFASFVCARAGQWNISFAVDRQHASADAAAEFLVVHPTLFAEAAQYDLRITVGATVIYLPACALQSLDPDEHSDQHTFTRYAFVGGSYTETEPA